MAERQPHRVASLFAGCGGLDLGFVGGFDFLGKRYPRTGFEVVWANELNPSACKTYARNLGDHVVCGDVKDVIGDIPQGVDVVKRLQPKAFVAENVGSLMMKQNEFSLKTILADFQSLGYDVTYHVYHAEDYGVPQTRERVIFVGTRPDVGRFAVPKPLKAKPVTASEALGDLETRERDKASSRGTSRKPSGRRWRADMTKSDFERLLDVCCGTLTHEARTVGFATAPQFEVELPTAGKGKRESLFEAMGISYDAFSRLDVHGKMKYVREYARKKHPGERLWWIDDSNGDEHTLPANIRLYTNLSPAEKTRLRAEAVLLCPSVLKSGRSRNKYDNVVMFMLSFHGVLCHQARDLFSAVTNKNGVVTDCAAIKATGGRRRRGQVQAC